MKAIILGSKRGIRYLDSDKSYPLALVEDKHGRRLLDWALSALDQTGITDVVFVGGYHIEKVVSLYPELRFYYNPDWQEGSDLKALTQASVELDGPCVIIQSDSIFRAAALDALLKTSADIVFADPDLRVADTDPSDKRFPGVVALSAQAAGQLREAVGASSQKPSPSEGDLRQTLMNLNLKTLAVDVGDDLMSVENPRSLSRFVFGSKAQTLERLQSVVTEAEILDQVRFTVEDWQEDRQAILDRVEIAVPSERLVIRSSALNEDSWLASQAGRFRSELDVDGTDPAAIQNAVELVIESFSENSSTSGLNEIFIQRHLDNVALSGVLFTRDPNTSAPYIVVNYDDVTKRTDSVTSGTGQDLRTAIIYKKGDPSLIDSRQMSQLIRLTNEVEELSGHDSLDIEFVFDTKGNLYLLQVRVLIGGNQDFELADADVDEELASLTEYIDELMRPRPHLVGQSTILANMPDWNPVELIGFSPRPLALSLFQYLITNHVWGQARVVSGYRDTYPEPLVVALAGHPYVDTRASLNSFLPSTLSDDLGAKLVEHSLKWLKEYPEFHDKLEFEVALTCLDFDFEEQRRRLLDDGFSVDEIDRIRETLRSLTNNIICGRVVTVEEQLRLVGQLGERRKNALDMPNHSLVSIARTVDFLLDDCINLGTRPFSVIARYAFIATSFLKSLQARGIFTPEEAEGLAGSIPTVATEISDDLRDLGCGVVTLDAFLEKYGHLRPGTFDITSPSYAEAPEFYFSNLDTEDKAAIQHDSIHGAKDLFGRKSREISELIQASGFTFRVSELRDFIVSSIPAREKAKFEFSKNVSAALSSIAELGEHLGLSRDDMSFLPITSFFALATGSPSSVLKKQLARNVTFNRKRHSLQKAVKLPHMITSTSDAYYFELLKWRPNFITLSRVTAPVVNVDEVARATDVTHKIVLIESADPGYDWLFGRGISGMITKYGGAASHMAIRAAELGVPAAIGCGELIYDKVSRAKVVELDCPGQRLHVVT